jgi:serine/threonine-protein kinase
VTAKIGSYTVESLIGQGSQGVVHRARAADGRLVAIKVLTEKVGTQAEDRARFSREAVAAARIDHPNVIEAIASGETEDGQLYLVTELLEGRSLAAEIADGGALASARVAAIGAQCAAALARAHLHGVVHRDVKPSNVFVCSGDVVKLLDFGLASVRGEQPLTAEGIVLGTPMYIAPEQVIDRSGPPADVYSLGCVLFEACTGAPPFGGNAIDVVRKHLREPPPAARTIRPDVPEALDLLLSAMLAKDPEKRPNAGDAERLLRMLAAEP